MRTTLYLTVIAVCLSGFAMGAAAQKPAPRKAKPAAQRAPQAAPQPAVPLTDEQLSIAQIVTTGTIPCAGGQSVKVLPNAKINGAFDLFFGKTQYGVIPIPSKSGAIRLEDKKSGIVFMQLANKSMLFNERQSKRLADDCISPEQKAVADDMLANPTASVLDTGSK